MEMTEDKISGVESWSWLKAINSEIEPGPASIGIANGVNAIEFLFCKSSSTSLLIPFRFFGLAFSKPNPELAIKIPPAILSAEIVIPKKLKTYSPIKKEINKMIQTFTAVKSDTRKRSVLL